MTTNQKVRGSTPFGCIVEGVTKVYNGAREMLLNSIVVFYYFTFIAREVAQLGSALGLGPRGRRFESCLHDNNFHGAFAQLGERLLCTQEVSGSIPLGSILI